MQQLPADAMALQQAMREYGHSREWYRSHVVFYYSGPLHTAYVSRSEVEREIQAAFEVTVRRPEDR